MNVISISKTPGGKAIQGYFQALLLTAGKRKLKRNLQLNLKIQSSEQIVFVSSIGIISEKKFTDYYRNHVVFILFQ